MKKKKALRLALKALYGERGRAQLGRNLYLHGHDEYKDTWYRYNKINKAILRIDKIAYP